MITAFLKDLMGDRRALGVAHDGDCVAAVLEPLEVTGDPGAHGRERHGAVCQHVAIAEDRR